MNHIQYFSSENEYALTIRSRFESAHFQIYHLRLSAIVGTVGNAADVVVAIGYLQWTIV